MIKHNRYGDTTDAGWNEVQTQGVSFGKEPGKVPKGIDGSLEILETNGNWVS